MYIFNFLLINYKVKKIYICQDFIRFIILFFFCIIKIHKIYTVIINSILFLSNFEFIENLIHSLEIIQLNCNKNRDQIVKD